MMTFDQREAPDPHHLEPVAAWVSDHLAEVIPSARIGARTLAAPGIPDFYVVVDELDELGCRLTVDRWPATDEDGRLVFDDERTQLRSVSPRVLHGFVTIARERSGEPAADRPLRIGDVFALWWGPFANDVLELPAPDLTFDLAAPADGPDGLELLDVTADARELTNAAAQAAAGDVLTESDMDLFGIDESDGRGGRG